MSNGAGRDREAPIEPIKQLRTELFREKCLPRVREIFSAHRVALEIKADHCLVIFPDGITRQEILPRPNFSVRSRITLPDGHELIDVVGRDSPLSSLGLPDEDFSDC
jgi:hypothetical protein